MCQHGFVMIEPTIIPARQRHVARLHVQKRFLFAQAITTTKKLLVAIDHSRFFT